MSDGAAGGTSLDRLRRLLHALPLAARRDARRDEWVPLAEIARELGVDASTIQEDLEEVEGRSYYHPADTGSDLQIYIEDGRVQVWTTGEFQRPVRLSMREALALALGIRAAGASSSSSFDAAEREELRRRMEEGLASASPEEVTAAFGMEPLEADGGGVRATLLSGARDRRPCTIRYVKPNAHGPEERRIHPYLIAYAEGNWYVLAHCEAAGTVRRFRVDRTVAARLDDGPFHGNPTFDPDDYLSDGRVFRCDREVEATVRYSPEVARWVAESSEGVWEPDGGFLVRHTVADPEWLARHVLGYAGEAEVLAPADLRSLVREAARSVDEQGDEREWAALDFLDFWAAVDPVEDRPYLRDPSSDMDAPLPPEA